MRENVFTQFARGINAFAQHQINKDQLYDLFAEMIYLSCVGEKISKKEYDMMIKEVDKIDITKEPFRSNNYLSGFNELNDIS